MNSVDSLVEDSRLLRRIADSYAQAQQARIQTGNRICAALAGCGQSPEGEDAASEAVLAAIRGGDDGPVPRLGRVYRYYWKREEDLARMLKERLPEHPAWPWLRQLQGIGPAVLGELCARLDATRAETPSAFWAYCGLGTVPGVEYHCPSCGLKGTFPVHARVVESHQRQGSAERCPDRLRRGRGPETGVRVAQPKPEQGDRPAYDPKAKQLCYLVGTSLLRAGGEYATYYRREWAQLEKTRPDWAPERRHMNALRKTEKLFLIHLWIVWRQALGLPITQPHAQPGEEGNRWADPWGMVAAAPSRRRWTRSEPAVHARHTPG